MNKIRLDKALVERGLTSTRSQAESYIKMGMVKIDGKTITKPGYFLSNNQKVRLDGDTQYVGRAGLKLAGAAESFELSFKGRVILDVGSSTGGFTDYALKNGAEKVIAVDVGSDQMHPSLRTDQRIELLEKTDIRSLSELSALPAIVLIDVSFISLREILPHIAKLAGKESKIVALVKPQFEAGADQITKGVIKNDNVRRQILKDFEAWAKGGFRILAKADSVVSGSKGNVERFYLLSANR